MNRKTIILILVSLILFSCKSKVEKGEEELKAEKVAFFNKKLNLTKEEADLFWPVYDEYWVKKNQIYDNRRSAMKYCGKNLEKLSDEEITKYADMYVNFKKEESDLLVEFNDKFKKVLPPTKVFLLYQTDYEFKNYLLKQIQNSGNK